MAFESLRHDADKLQDETKAYLESTTKYYKLLGFKIAMQSISMVVRTIIVGLCLTIILLFASIAASLALGQLLDNYVYGFLIVAGFYALLLVIFLVLKDNVFRRRILVKFSEIYFNED